MPAPSPSGVRLNKFLASCGVDSRRRCDDLIRQGRVEINGEIVVDLATRVEDDDHVKFDGKLLRQRGDITVAFYKPKGVICTHDDPEDRDTVYDLLPKSFQKLNYIGRLDYQSEGLLLLTSSGDLIEKLTHPRFHVEKEYIVQLNRGFMREEIPQFLEGMPFSEGVAKAKAIHCETRRTLYVTLTQGFNRQIRRMFARLDYKVKRLERIRIGSLTLPGLAPGDHLVLSNQQIKLASTNPE